MGKILKVSKSKARNFTAKSGWREINGKKIYFRSLWEFRYALYLQFLKTQNQIIDWEYEPQTFWFEEIKRGTRSYKPDFLVHDTTISHYWVEVKGFMDNRSQTKIKRFHKYYPNEKLMVISRSWFLQNAIFLSAIGHQEKKVIKMELISEGIDEKE